MRDSDGSAEGTPGIGTLNEKGLHAGLKRWCARPGDRLEVPVDGFVVDILRGDEIIEVQTGSFAQIRRKLRTLVADHSVRLLYPVAEQRWIVKLAAGGGDPVRRKSPRRGHVHDLFNELVSFPDLLGEPGFSLEVVRIHEEEVRRTRKRPRRRGRDFEVVERRLLEVVASDRFDEPRDLLRLLPGDLPDPFGTFELAGALRQPRWLAQRATYCLSRAGVIREVGKKGNARLYSVEPEPAKRKRAAARKRRPRQAARSTQS